MNKKIVYIGIAFIIASVLVILISTTTTSSIGTALQKTLITDNITLNPGAISSTPISLTANSYIFAFIAMNGSANIYLFNSTGYKFWINETDAANSLSGLDNAKGLEGAGVLLIYRNTTNATIPSGLTSSNATPIYTVNQSQLYATGTYYFVIDNSNGSASHNNKIGARFVYLPPFTNSSLTSGQYAGLGNQLDEAVSLGILFFVLFIIGIILVIYGVIKDPKDKQPKAPKVDQPEKLETKADQQYVDQLYKNVDRKKRRKTKSKTRS